MREIKFRAWMPYNEDPNDMRMEYYPQLFAEDGNGIFNINSVFAHPVDYFADNGTYPEAVIKFMQYTGLHDKNGREIYEGDIVHAYDQEPDRYEPDYRGSEATGIVEFHGSMFMLDDDIVLDYPPILEVIGNIFENTEMLEAGK